MRSWRHAPFCMPKREPNWRHQASRRAPSGDTHAGMSLFSTPGKRTERPPPSASPQREKAISSVEKLSKEHGANYGVSDIMRIALSRLYENESTQF